LSIVGVGLFGDTFSFFRYIRHGPFTAQNDMFTANAFKFSWGETAIVPNKLQEVELTTLAPLLQLPFEIHGRINNNTLSLRKRRIIRYRARTTSEEVDGGHKKRTAGRRRNFYDRTLTPIEPNCT
jgi:hypothetical protein